MGESSSLDNIIFWLSGQILAAVWQIHANSVMIQHWSTPVGLKGWRFLWVYSRFPFLFGQLNCWKTMVSCFILLIFCFERNSATWSLFGDFNSLLEIPQPQQQATQAYPRRFAIPPMSTASTGAMQRQVQTSIPPNWKRRRVALKTLVSYAVLLVFRKYMWKL